MRTDFGMTARITRTDGARRTTFAARTAAILLAALASSVAVGVRAQGWFRLYDGAAHLDDVAHTLARDTSGNLYVAGSTTTVSGTTDILLLKYSADGALQWQATADPSAGGDDQALALVLDGAGNAILAGSARAGYDADLVVLKYTPAGALAWQRTFVGTTASDDGAVAIATDGANRIVVLGSTFSSTTGADFLLLQYSADGTLTWQVTIDGGAAAADYPTALAVNSTGDAVATGFSTRSDLTTDVLTIRCTASGTVAWSRLYAGSASDDDWGLDVVLDATGNTYVTGFVETGAASADCVTLKYASDGSLAWDRVFDGSLQDHDSGHAIAVDTSGNVYVGGATRDAAGAFDFLVLAYSNAGGFLWSRSWSGAADGRDEAGLVAADGSGGVLVVGESDGSVGGLDIVTLRYSSAGAVLGQGRFAGSAHGVDSPGGLVVAGPSLGSLVGTSAESTGDDALVLTFDPTTITDVEVEEVALPNEVTLTPFRPHPLRAGGVIRFAVPRPAKVTLEIVNVAGRVVRRLMANEPVGPGHHVHSLERGQLPAGVYFIVLRVQDDISTVTRRQKIVRLP